MIEVALSSECPAAQKEWTVVSSWDEAHAFIDLQYAVDRQEDYWSWPERTWTIRVDGVEHVHAHNRAIWEATCEDGEVLELYCRAVCSERNVHPSAQ